MPVRSADRHFSCYMPVIQLCTGALPGQGISAIQCAKN